MIRIIIPENINQFKRNNRNAKKNWEICSKLTIKTPEQLPSDAFDVNFKHISHLFLVSLLMTLIIYVMVCWDITVFLQCSRVVRERSSQKYFTLVSLFRYCKIRGQLLLCACSKKLLFFGKIKKSENFNTLFSSFVAHLFTCKLSTRYIWHTGILVDKTILVLLSTLPKTILWKYFQNYMCNLSLT